tara:strand:- start:20074 stop:20706 length:633 start_codon:yes stop_codon:yes gene_type:complete
MDNSMGYILNYDNSFIHTLKVLLIKPETVIKEYLAGKRKKYFSPFKLLLLTTSLLALTFVFLPDVTKQPNIGESSKEFAEIFKVLFERFFSLTIFLAIPASALINKLLFKKVDYNFAEHLVVTTYTSSAVNVFNIIIYTCQMDINVFTVAVSIILGIGIFVYTFRAYVKVFEEKWIIGILKAILSNIISSILYLMEFLILGAIYYFLYYR